MSADYTMHAGQPFRIDSTAKDVDGVTIDITGTGTFKLYDRPRGADVFTGDYDTDDGKAISTLDPSDTDDWDARVLYFEVKSTTLGIILESGKLRVL